MVPPTGAATCSTSPAGTRSDLRTWGVSSRNVAMTQARTAWSNCRRTIRPYSSRPNPDRSTGTPSTTASSRTAKAMPASGCTAAPSVTAGASSSPVRVSSTHSPASVLHTGSNSAGAGAGRNGR